MRREKVVFISWPLLLHLLRDGSSLPQVAVVSGLPPLTRLVAARLYGDAVVLTVAHDSFPEVPEEHLPPAVDVTYSTDPVQLAIAELIETTYHPPTQPPLAGG